MKKLFTISIFILFSLLSMGQKSVQCNLKVDSFHVVRPSCDTCCDGIVTCYPVCGTPPYLFDWLQNNISTPTATLKGVCYSTNYLYVVVTDSFGRTIDSILVNNVTALQIINTSEEVIKVYPNPSSGLFTFNLQGNTQKCTIEIYNMLGENLYNSHFSATTTQIDLSGRPAGIYLYRVVTDRGVAVASGKVIIK